MKYLTMVEELFFTLDIILACLTYAWGLCWIAWIYLNVFYCVYSGTLCIVNNNFKMYSAMQNPWLNIIDLKAVILHLSPKLVSRGQDGNVYWDVLISVLSPPKIVVGWSPEWLYLSSSYLSNVRVK